MRIWREVVRMGLYLRYECECSEKRSDAQRFAEWLGFKRLYVADGFVHYFKQGATT